MKDLPKRRSPRLENFDYSQNAAFFVTVCTKNRECILSDIIQPENTNDRPCVRLKEIGRIAEEYIQNIHGIDQYIIMPNHIHMIIINENGPMWASAPTDLSDIIRSFKTLVSKKTGCHVWQRSYHDHIIRSVEDYEAHLKYIYENPEKWVLDKYYPQVLDRE